MRQIDEVEHFVSKGLRKAMWEHELINLQELSADLYMAMREQRDMAPHFMSPNDCITLQELAADISSIEREARFGVRL